MILLSNGCYRSEIEVTPKNWKKTPNSKKVEQLLINKEWRIYYRFYDPAYKGTKLWGKLIPVKGMNGHKDLATRQDVTAALLSKEKEKLDRMGYNPITDTYLEIQEVTDGIEEVNSDTLFISALKQAVKLVKVSDNVRKDLLCISCGMESSAGKLLDKKIGLLYTSLAISQVSRRHIIYCFEQCAKDNPRFSINRRNKYRTGLLILYRKLIALEAVDFNPIIDIPIEKGHIKRKPKLLSEAERLIIDTNVRAWDYHYWRYMRIFFRSGSRSTELLALKRDENIDLEQQEFTIVVRKGREYREDIRPIPDDILPLWIEAYEEAAPGQYLFSTYFKPGAQLVDSDYVNKRWTKYVKNDPGKYDPFNKGWGLGIKKDFYKLKALNADSIDAQVDIEHAAAADGHTDTRTTKKYYALGHEKRKREKLKSVVVKFA